MSIITRLAARPSRILSHSPTQGLSTEVTVARLGLGDRTEPIEQLLTTTGTNAKGATTLNLSTTIVQTIAAGQYLNFYDSTDGSEYICEVTAAAASGDTSLTVAALPEAIPASSKGEFPPVIFDLTDASVDRSYNRAAQATFHTGGFEDGIVTGGSYSMTLPTVYYAKNAGAATLLKAANATAEVYLARELSPPSTAFSKGRVIKGAAVVTAAPEASSVDGFVTQDFTITYQGQPTDSDPVATA